MRVAILHDQYLPNNTLGVSGEDNLVDLEVSLLKERGHQVIDLREIESGLKRKFLQGAIHVFGYGAGLPSLKSVPDVIHVHNLNQRTGYAWLKNSPAPVVQSLHNLRTFCAISIGWRSEKQCFECLKRPTFYGLTGSLRNILFQRNRPQLRFSNRLIASSEVMKRLFSEVFPENRIDVIHNPGIQLEQIETNKNLKGWLFAGRLVYEKGILNLIDKWPKEELLDIAGSGPLSEEIKLRVKESPNIRLIGVFEKNNKAIYRDYEGLFFASTWMEGSPLVVADAIANGLPVIAFGKSAVIEQISKTNGGIYMGEDISREAIRNGISIVRNKSSELKFNCQISSQGFLSTNRWISQVEESLRLATVH
jgi:glycosyltransferase involved in cell wall biosynthesis